MATCTTPQWSDGTTPQIRLNVNVTSNTATSATLTWTLQYVAHGYAANTSGGGRSYSVVIAGVTVSSGTYNINGITGTTTIASGTKTIPKTTALQNITFSCSMAFNITWSGVYGGTKSASGSIAIGCKSTYSIWYNANGGSGAPSLQTKWHDTPIVLSSVKPIRTGYTFQGWATSSTGGVVYASGATYSANAVITLYAVWKPITYTVAFNTNGGSGTLTNQVKTYGITLTLSSVIPTRTNYNFLGWGTSANASTPVYQPGGTYANDSSITLYAIWELAYVKPRINNFSVERCDSSGEPVDINIVDETYIRVKFDWVTDRPISYVSVNWALPSGFNGGVSIDYPTIPASYSGSFDQIINQIELSVETTCDITVKVNDTYGFTPIYTTLESRAFAIDVLNGGDGIAFGKTAELKGVMDVNFEAKFRRPVEFDEPVIFNVKPLNRVLWSGHLHMTGEQSIQLSEAISAQEHGIVLVWSYYTEEDGAKDHSFNTDFVSKYQVATHPACGHTFLMSINAGFSALGSKYLFFTDTTITGHSGNTISGSNSGITFDNAAYVLRYVIGI